MPFSKENEQKIQKNHMRIVNGLSHVKIVDSLISKKVLTIDDGERINSKPTQLDKNKEFIRLLRKGPEKGYNEFIEELRNDPVYVELADQIEKTEVNIQEQTLENWIGTDRITPEKRNTCLEDRDLLRFSEAISPAHLSQLGRILKIPKDQVDDIMRDHLLSKKAWSMEFLLKWRDKYQQSATAGNLVDKLFQAWKITPECIDPKFVRNSWDKL